MRLFIVLCKWLWRNPWEKQDLHCTGRESSVCGNRNCLPQTKEENKIQDQIRRPSLLPSLLQLLSPGQSRGTPASLSGLRPRGAGS